jgi:cyclopropane fatty-acyl-phospholipid synthase-like methyltransferase
MTNMEYKEYFKKIENELEVTANFFLVINSDPKQEQSKPNWSNRTFMNTLIIFQSALMDKLYDNQEFDNMPFEERIKMAESCGKELRKLIHTYTNLDTHKMEDFL